MNPLQALISNAAPGHNPDMQTLDEIQIIDLLKRDQRRWDAMGAVAELGLPEGCIGAGFVRNLVWDNLHGRSSDCRNEDLDVLFHDPATTDAAYDADLEAALQKSDPTLRWSVKNQARMHLRNGDAPYTSVEDAMRFWPETATAVAGRRQGNDCVIIAPFGVRDLADLTLRPTSCAQTKISAFHARIKAKGWRERWPRVRATC